MAGQVVAPDAFLDEHHGERSVPAGAPVQELGVRVAHAEEGELHPFARKQNIVGEDRDPRAGVVVPRATGGSFQWSDELVVRMYERDDGDVEVSGNRLRRTP